MIRSPRLRDVFFEVLEPKKLEPPESEELPTEIEPLPEIEGLPDNVVITALKKDSERMESGIVDDDSSGGEPPRVEEISEDLDGMNEKSTGVSGKALVEDLIEKSKGILRSSGTKKGAYRVQPVDSNNPPPPDHVLRFIKSAKLIVVRIIGPGQVGAASSKFNTYIIKRRGVPSEVKFVYGQGRNEGQKFEETAVGELQQAIGTGGKKMSPFVQTIFAAMKIKPGDVREIKLASARAVKRPITNEIQNVGPMISDIDIVLKNGKTIYISLKNESGATFANSGYKGAFVPKAIGRKVVFVSHLHRLDDFIVGALGVNKQLVAQGITEYYNKTISAKPIVGAPIRTNTKKVKQYLMSSYGYGYWYIRKRGGNKVDVINITTPKNLEMVVGDIVSTFVTYPFWSKTKATKQLTVKIETSKAKYFVEVRNSKGDVEPTEVKVKIGGKTS